MNMQAPLFLMLYCFQLASISLHAKKKTVCKRGGPSAALTAPSIQSKRAHVEEADNEVGVPVSQPMHSSNAPVYSVSPSLASVLEMFPILCIFLRRLPRRIPYICFMKGLILLLMALWGRTAISTTSAISVVGKYSPLLVP